MSKAKTEAAKKIIASRKADIAIVKAKIAYYERLASYYHRIKKTESERMHKEMAADCRREVKRLEKEAKNGNT